MTTQPVTQIPQNRSAEIKHTPGPWRFCDNSLHWKTNPFSVTVRKHGVHSSTVANIPHRETISMDEQRSNAKLISQTPEMWTCLLSMLRWYSNRLNGHDISPYDKQPPEIQRAMRVYKSITGEDYK